MRRERTGPRRRNAAGVALSLLLGVGTTADAGMRFAPDLADPLGSDVRSLAASSGALWAGTVSGVFRGTDLASAWTLDGLAGKPVSSVAVLNGEAWAATGEELWRRAADGTWARETLPSSSAFPTTVAVDAGGTLWLGGLGVWRRNGTTWAAASR